MAPVILALKKETWARTTVLATAQHREMLDQALSSFRIATDVDLNLMEDDQSFADITARLFSALDATIAGERPAVVVSQGDATTMMVTAMVSFYRGIPFCHVEAGLRTHDMGYPFPEEMNRVVASKLARLHFAPTENARRNLLREGIEDSSINVTGNTVIDALLHTAEKDLPMGVETDAAKRLILLTAHRRENFGKPLRNIFQAVRQIVDEIADVEILYPVHPNPNVLKLAREHLSNHPRIRLCRPMDYGPFVSAMKYAYLILTDSGGIQEEAPALGKPVLVLRHETERPEAVAEGVVKLVGTKVETIVSETRRLLDDPLAYKAMAKGFSPYGDGHAAERIVAALRHMAG